MQAADTAIWTPSQFRIRSRQDGKRADLPPLGPISFSAEALPQAFVLDERVNSVGLGQALHLHWGERTKEIKFRYIELG
jgi:hypothetical protein